MCNYFFADNPDQASTHLVEYAKHQGSTDNITVIIVFLTPPIQIAARPFFTHPLLTDDKLDNMDPDQRYLSNANGQYDVNETFMKQPTHTNGSSHEEGAFVFGKPSNGSLNNPLLDYPENCDMDFGPETDVDALDDSRENVGLENVSRELFPYDDVEDEFSNKNVDNKTAAEPSMEISEYSFL